jgi:serine/threonine-protein kinase
MTPCPDPAQLRRFADRELAGPDEADVARHVAACPACREFVGAAADRTAETQVRASSPSFSATDSPTQTLQPFSNADTPTQTAQPFSGSDSPTNTLQPSTGTDAPTQTVQHPSHTASPDETQVRPPSTAGFGVRPADGTARVPGYEIRDVLGRGGMGVVYKARQTALDRAVALKMIRSGAHATDVDRARLRSEAELVARLTHPNVVQIYEVGEIDGQPYLAMEFVDGGNLAGRLAAGLPPPRAVAALLATLAGAVQAAHFRNVIHRDLKPANVLLTAAGVPKIADFGLARALDAETRHTVSGEILGTPAFMAPEQATGVLAAVGPAADIYALGAILYAALTGRPPFAAESTVATLMKVCHEEPPPPSRLRAGVPRDLERICLKCLAKSPDARYASAADLAADLNRYLRGEPVTARPVGAAVRVWKWTRRHPTWAALAAVGLLVLAGGLWYNGRLQGARAESAARAELARAAADAITPLAEEWLETEPGQDPAREQILLTALGVYQTLAQQEGGDPSLRQATALAQFRCARIYSRLVRPDEAERAYDRAIRLQEALSRENPGEPSYRQDLANSYSYRGELLREAQRPEEALSWYDRALALQTELVSSDDRPKYRLEQARSEYNRALALRQRGLPEEALNWFGRAADLLRPAAADNTGDPSYAQELARAFLNRATVLAETQRVAEAVETCRRAVAVQRDLTTDFSKPEYRYELAVSLFNLGNYLRTSGNPLEQAQAPAAYEESRALLTPLVDQFPARLFYARQLASTYNGLGTALSQDKGRWGAAEAALGESARRFELLVKQNADLADCHFLAGQAAGNLGWLLLWKQNEARKARPELERAARHLEHPSNQKGEYPASHQTWAKVYGSLAEACLRLGDPASAADAIERFLSRQPATDQERYYLARNYARCSALPADAAASNRYVRRACELLGSVDPQKYHPQDDPNVGKTLPGSDPDFKGLWGRSEFVELRARWSAK